MVVISPHPRDKKYAIAIPYPELNAVLHEWVASIQAILGDTFVAACLQGSFAVGDFDRDSDVDFIVVIEQELSADQAQALQAMHQRIYNLDCEWASQPSFLRSTASRPHGLSTHTSFHPVRHYHRDAVH